MSMSALKSELTRRLVEKRHDVGRSMDAFESPGKPFQQAHAGWQASVKRGEHVVEYQLQISPRRHNSRRVTASASTFTPDVPTGPEP